MEDAKGCECKRFLQRTGCVLQDVPGQYALKIGMLVLQEAMPVNRFLLREYSRACQSFYEGGSLVVVILHEGSDNFESQCVCSMRHIQGKYDGEGCSNCLNMMRL
jgi:hypothetical protein